MRNYVNIFCGFALAVLMFSAGCAAYGPEIRSPRYFNTEVEIVDYYATPFNTTWTMKAKPGETMRLVFNYEIIDIDFEPSETEPGEYIFVVRSEVHGQ